MGRKSGVEIRKGSVPIIKRIITALLLLQQFSNAKITGFVSNDYVECGYPFEEFEIEKISCNYNRSWYSFDTYYKNREEGICYWGQNMKLRGKVTVSEGVYRYFDNTVIQLCFGDSSCKTIQTKVDLFSLVGEDEEDDEANNEDEADQVKGECYSNFCRYNYHDFLFPGTYEFSGQLRIPEMKFTNTSQDGK